MVEQRSRNLARSESMKTLHYEEANLHRPSFDILSIFGFGVCLPGSVYGGRHGDPARFARGKLA